MSWSLLSLVEESKTKKVQVVTAVVLRNELEWWKSRPSASEMASRGVFMVRGMPDSEPTNRGCTDLGLQSCRDAIHSPTWLFGRSIYLILILLVPNK